MNALMTRAKALDNGGQWFKARTTRTVAEIEAKFRTGDVASILYERIGGLVPVANHTVCIQVALQTDKIIVVGDEPTFITQPIDAPDWNVLLGLKELGVKLGKPVSTSPIK